MSQPCQSLKPWLLSYIEQRRAKQSRYQIDKYLIALGNDPAEIELVWQSFEPPPPIKTTPFFQKNWKEILLVILVFLVVFVVSPLLKTYFPSFDQDFWFISALIMTFIVLLLVGLKTKKY